MPKYILDLPKRPYRLWCPLTHLFSGDSERLSQGQKPPNLKADVCDLVSRSRTNGSEHLLPHTLSWRVQGTALLAEGANLMEPYSVLLQRRWLLYEGQSNEYLKSAIKIRNTSRLSCKVTTVILMV